MLTICADDLHAVVRLRPARPIEHSREARDRNALTTLRGDHLPALAPFGRHSCLHISNMGDKRPKRN